jgi:predicted nucleic acid-binding protein
LFANRFTAVIDACVLADVARRDLILSLAEAGLFRLRWSQEILDETERAIASILKEDQNAKQRAARSIALMKKAFPEALEDEHPQIRDGLSCLPDKNDHHVLAIAIGCKASLIVTENLKDFPAAALEPYDLEAKGGDAFLADAIDLDYPKAVAAVKRLRARLQQPSMSVQELFERWRNRGLAQTVDALFPHADNL